MVGSFLPDRVTSPVMVRASHWRAAALVVKPRLSVRVPSGLV